MGARTLSPGAYPAVTMCHGMNAVTKLAYWSARASALAAVRLSVPANPGDQRSGHRFSNSDY